ncbi:MAG TPA: pseudouridine-5'-phosphate glycosidase [Candidatus Dormibacteraeota bacterium]
MIQLGRAVAEALAAGRPVVALETSIVAQGLPPPHNLRAAFGCEDAIAGAGAVPATVAVLAGRLKVGLERDEIEALAADETAVKVSARDLGWAVAAGRSGATTVAATARAAQLAGIRFFATGGIGGVHRGNLDDVSADLAEIARAPVAVFCAGAKMILDLPRTLERLETLGVPVLGYGTDEFPAFYTARSGLPVGARVDTPEEVAAALRASWELGGRGIVVAVAPPLELAGAEGLVQQAVAEVGAVEGPGLTPRLLARIADLSGGRSLDVNVELVINNARVAAASAVAFAA